MFSLLVVTTSSSSVVKIVPPTNPALDIFIISNDLKQPKATLIVASPLTRSLLHGQMIYLIALCFNLTKQNSNKYWDKELGH